MRHLSALRSERPYRGAWDAERTREHLVSQKGRHFQPALVDAFPGLDAEALRHRDYEGSFQDSLVLGTSD